MQFEGNLDVVEGVRVGDIVGMRLVDVGLDLEDALDDEVVVFPNAPKRQTIENTIAPITGKFNHPVPRFPERAE